MARRRIRSQIKLTPRHRLLNDKDPFQRVVSRRYPKYIVNQPGPGPITKRATKRYS